MLRSIALLVLVASTALADGPLQLKGTVKERVDSGGYSYLRIATAKGDEWAAVPQAEFKVGEAVTVDVQAKMRDFESKTLKRTWADLAFGTVAGAPATGPSAAAPGMKPGMANPHEQGLPKTSPATPGLEGEVLEVLQTSSYTYLRLQAKGGETWAAVPRAEVAVGAKVRVRSPQPMDGFKSPSLKRTFAKIVFGTLDAQ